MPSRPPKKTTRTRTDRKTKPKDEGKKKAAGVARVSGEPLKGMRAESDIQAIAALCKMAG